MSRRRRRAARPSALVVSGLAEVAAGALAGWPYTLVRQHPDVARKLGVRAPARVRQWHLDLTMLGGLTAMAGTAVPDLPRAVAVPLGVGAWTNAMMFLPLAFAPEVDESPVYKTAAALSFTATSVGFAGLAVTAARRRFGG